MANLTTKELSALEDQLGFETSRRPRPPRSRN